MPEFRNKLNTFCQKKWRRTDVAWFEVNSIGTPSSPWFEAICYIFRDEYSTECGPSKDKAKEAAAEKALTLLRQEYPGIYDED